jgi:hypothetical protein
MSNQIIWIGSQKLNRKKYENRNFCKKKKTIKKEKKFANINNTRKEIKQHTKPYKKRNGKKKETTNLIQI